MNMHLEHEVLIFCHVNGTEKVFVAGTNGAEMTSCVCVCVCVCAHAHTCMQVAGVELPVC